MATGLGNKLALLAIICTALLNPACRTGTQGGESWTRASGLPSETTAPAKNGEIKDPIVSMLVAASIDNQGRVAKPKFTFDPTEPQVTVIALVGKITNAPLDLIWYQVTDDGAQRLFAHQVQVNSYERAYSIGKNPGLLSGGTYAVVGTLAGQTRIIEFDVKQTAAPRTMSGTRSSKRNERGYASGEAPSLLAGDWYQGFSTLAGQAKTIAFELPGEATPPTGALPASTQQGQPPVQGTSGVVPQPEIPRGPRVGTSVSGCYVLPEGDYPDWETQVADVIDVSCRGDCSAPPPGLHTIIVSATVSGPSKPIGSYVGSEGGALADYYVDPCYLSGGSDLPGTKVVVTSSVKDSFDQTKEIGSVNATFTLADDTYAPRLDVVSTPARGAKVKAGDKISLKIKANEVRRGQSWQSGVMDIQLTANNELVTSKDYLQYRGKSCDAKSWEKTLDVTYTVPSNPPPIINFCAITDDFAGNQNFLCGEFLTRGDWYGTLDWSAWNQVFSGRQYWYGHADLVLDDDGRGGLTGTLVGTESQRLATSCPSYTITPGPVRARLTGTHTGQRITINVPDIERTPAQVTPCPWGPPEVGSVLIFKSALEEVFHGLAPTSSGAYQSDRELTIATATARFTLKVRPVKR